MEDDLLDRGKENGPFCSWAWSQKGPTAVLVR
jgi:hypothetical protein